MKPIHFASNSVVLLAAMLSGCAGILEQQQQALCTPQTAYERGYNHGKSGAIMQSSAESCPQEIRESVASRYQQGYLDAQPRPVENSIQAGIPPNPAPTSIKVKVAGRSGQTEITIPVGGGSTSAVAPAPQAPHPKAFFCRVDAFGKSYRGFGPTELETRQAVAGRCRSVAGDLACEQIGCRENPVAFPPNPKAWFCSGKAFTATFEAFGNSELEARDAVFGQCLAGNSAMHCDDISCQPNR